MTSPGCDLDFYEGIFKRFPENQFAGTLSTTQLPVFSTNSSPTAKPVCGTVLQYATRATERNEPAKVVITSLSLVCHRRALRTRAPSELTFSVKVVSTPGNTPCPLMSTPTSMGTRGSRRAAV